MKKIITTALVLSGLIANAQYEKRVGINTDKPRASLEVKAVTVDGRAQGILFPHISDAEKKNWQPNGTTGLVAGTMIWNTDLNCLDHYDGEKWQCTDGSNPYYPPINTTPDKTIKANVWNRTHYIGSFNHNGANIDGEITNTGTNALTLQIPYNQATAGKSYNEINITRTVQDRSGANKTLTLHIPAGTFSGAKGFLTATIKVGNGTSDIYKVKQLPANTEETITEFSFTINGGVSNVRLIASGGVLDRNFGKTNYNLIYVPVSVYTDLVDRIPNSGAPYEGKWLNNNLGANYANLDKTAVFNPTKQAQSHDDYNAYGSLFQWQRPADGHELVNWTSSTAGTLTATTTTLWDNTNWAPNHSNFIRGNYSTNYSWVSNTVNTNTSYHNLWQSGGQNNPCPQGYHPPLSREMNSFGAIFVASSLDYFATQFTLRLPAAGRRDVDDGGQADVGARGYYWGSEMTKFNWPAEMWFQGDNGVGTAGPEKAARGHSVRCIAD